MRGGSILRSVTLCALAAATWTACGGKATTMPDAQNGGTPEASDGGNDGGPLTCDEQSLAGSQAVMLAIDAVRDDESCSTDSDCTAVALQTDCYGDQCEAFTVNQAGAAKLSAALANINATTCAGYAAKGCPAACCPSCPPSPRPYCVDGTCQDFVEDASAP